MVTYFEYRARQVLNFVTVVIQPAYNFSGSGWSGGEIARVDVDVTNTCGLPLRDVAVKLSASGGATVLRRAFWLSDTVFWEGLEPDETKQASFRLYADSTTEITTAVVSATLFAEVVPYVARGYDARREETIYPS